MGALPKRIIDFLQLYIALLAPGGAAGHMDASVTDVNALDKFKIDLKALNEAKPLHSSTAVVTLEALFKEPIFDVLLQRLRKSMSKDCTSELKHFNNEHLPESCVKQLNINQKFETFSKIRCLRTNKRKSQVIRKLTLLPVDVPNHVSKFCSQYLKKVIITNLIEELSEEAKQTLFDEVTRNYIVNIDSGLNPTSPAFFLRTEHIRLLSDMIATYSMRLLIITDLPNDIAHGLLRGIFPKSQLKLTETIEDVTQQSWDNVERGDTDPIISIYKPHQSPGSDPNHVGEIRARYFASCSSDENLPIITSEDYSLIVNIGNDDAYEAHVINQGRDKINDDNFVEYKLELERMNENNPLESSYAIVSADTLYDLDLALNMLLYGQALKFEYKIDAFNFNKALMMVDANTEEKDCFQKLTSIYKVRFEALVKELSKTYITSSNLSLTEALPFAMLLAKYLNMVDSTGKACRVRLKRGLLKRLTDDIEIKSRESMFEKITKERLEYEANSRVSNSLDVLSLICSGHVFKWRHVRLLYEMRSRYNMKVKVICMWNVWLEHKINISLFPRKVSSIALIDDHLVHNDKHGELGEVSSLAKNKSVLRLGDKENQVSYMASSNSLSFDKSTYPKVLQLELLPSGVFQEKCKHCLK